MLQRQRLHWYLLQPRYDLNGLKVRYQCLDKIGYSTLRNLPPCKESNVTITQATESSIPLRYVRENHATSLNRYLNKDCKHEPWIKLDSLSETLEAHQKANKDGTARDGAPIKTARAPSQNFLTSQGHSDSWAEQKLSDSETYGIAPTATVSYSNSYPTLSSEWRYTHRTPLALRLPWLFGGARSENSICRDTSMERLNTEIQGCARYFTPSMFEQHAALDAFDEIAEIITQTLGSDVIVDLIGSRKTGTARPTSDLDINIRLQSEAGNNGSSQSKPLSLRALDKAMRNLRFANTVLPHAYIRKTPIPIVTGTHLGSGLEFQIQSTNSAFDSQEVTKAFVAEYPAACVLFKIVKQMLLMRGLTKGWLGGITSYPLFNMVIVSLKLANAQIPKHDIASHLLQFLNFWSKFNFNRDKIVLRSPEVKGIDKQHIPHAIDPISSIPMIVAKTDKHKMSRYTMSCEDPADAFNDLGKSCHEIENIQACFIEAMRSLQRSMKSWDGHRDNRGWNDEYVSILAWCIAGDYTSYAEARWQLNQYGQWLQTEKK